MLILNYNSWHSKLYRWFYNRSQLPANLCPYFSKLVLALTLSPALFMLKLVNPIKRIVFEGEARSIGLGFNIFVYLAIFLIELLLWTTALVIKYGFYYMNKAHVLATAIWWSIICIGVILGLAYCISRIAVSIIERDKNNVISSRNKKKWLVIESFKSWYRKNCPLIKWEKQNL